MGLEQQVDLKPYNTFGLSVRAEYFSTFKSVDELRTIMEHHADKPFLILGGGSNLLLTKDVAGIVLKNDLKGIEIVSEEDDSVIVKAAAGEIWHEFVLHCIKEGLGGVENMSLIPGSIGAAPMQNIGAYGVEIKDVFHSLDALEVKTGKIRTFSKEECAFGYRESVFKRALKGKYIITSVSLKLSRKPTLNTSYGAIEMRLNEMGISNPTIKDVSDAVIHIRRSKLPDPKQIGNSGSFFKNPVISRSKFEEIRKRFPDMANYPVDDKHVKIAAGWLIDNAGWKGKTLGNYGVHKNQALVLVNYGDAKGLDIYQLSEDIMASVMEIYGIELEREVNVI
jgi:UDP-N-acetylmuramate dehydrogenase